MLKNSNLPEKTLNNARSELIKLTEIISEKNIEASDKVVVDKATIIVEELGDLSENLRGICNRVKVSKSLSELEKYRKGYHHSKTIQKCG